MEPIWDLHTGYEDLVAFREAYDDSQSFGAGYVAPRLQALYDATGEQKLQIYEQWCQGYDEEILSELGYIAPVKAGEVFASHVYDRNSYILDAACGTGLVGLQLSEYGYINVDGLDFSLGMLERSTKKVVYKRFIHKDIAKPIGLDQRYDAAICVGLFGFGMPGIDSLAHLMASVKTGGVAVVTVNALAWAELGLAEEVRRLGDAAGFLVEKIVDQAYIRNGKIRSNTLVIRRIG